MKQSCSNESAAGPTRRPGSASSVRPSSGPPRSSSSASLRPPSSAARPIRPSSSASTRPSSSASVRPSSSNALARPASSASRPGSRTTQRPASRFGHRSSTKQSSRLISLYSSLVTHITGLTAEVHSEKFRAEVEQVSKQLDQTAKPSGSYDMKTASNHIRGHIEKARINALDDLANALEMVQTRLDVACQQQDDLDADLKISRFPSHLQLLISLSLPPSLATLAYAKDSLDKITNPPSSLTWKDILAEEPFEGQHWEGVYGLPPGSTVENWESRTVNSTPSLSPLEDSDLEDSFSSIGSGDYALHPSPTLLEKVQDAVAPQTRMAHHYNHRKDIEELRARQYWRAEWRIDASIDSSLDIGDPSTLGPSLHRALGNRTPLFINELQQEKYIYEHDLVREVLMALQGRKNIVLTWMRTGDHPFSFVLSPTAPRLLHLSSTAQASILSPFAETATTAEHLRKFVSAVFTKTLHARPVEQQITHFSRRNTRTIEAFADAVDSQLRVFDMWCAAKEQQICQAQAGVGPSLVISLLNLEKALRDTFSTTFRIILDVLHEVVQRALHTQEPIGEVWTITDLPTRISPSALTSLLLDTLLRAVQEYTSMGDNISSSALMRVFIETAEPIWGMIGRWLRDGMPVREAICSTTAIGPGFNARTSGLDEEFFVEDNELVLLDPDLWSEGFCLRDGNGELGEVESRRNSVPVFLKHVARGVLGAGKAVGLLRALDVTAMLETQGERWMKNWRSFGTVLQASTGSGCISGDTDKLHRATTSTDDLSHLIYDELMPYCRSAEDRLTRVLVEDCDMWLHLTAMEDLYLMRRGDALSHFVDILFARMDSRQNWTDFHFLNGAFRKVALQGTQRWIDPSLVRFSHRGVKDKSTIRTVRAIDGLLIEYAVPFPLTYIFGAKAMQVYSSIFSFVLMVRRAKSTLESILVRGALEYDAQRGEMKAFYAMRGKLSWFVNTLLAFVATYVLHVQVVGFHADLRNAKSLDEMIQLHDTHLGKIQGRCLLQHHTSALHRAILSILDMALYFSDCFIAFAGDTTHDISRHSVIKVKRHRSRRVRRQRRNTIGFSQSIQDADESSDSESEIDDESILQNTREPSFSLGTSSISFAEETFLVRLDKMSAELDALVRFIRRGVESLAGGTGEAAPTFGIFAFALEDWDR